MPLFRPVPAADAARRLEAVARAYGGCTGREVLAAVPVRVQVAVDGIRTAVAAGDAGMANLLLVGEPERTEVALAAHLDRVGDIERQLP